MNSECSREEASKGRRALNSILVVSSEELASILNHQMKLANPFAKRMTLKLLVIASHKLCHCTKNNESKWHETTRCTIILQSSVNHRTIACSCLHRHVMPLCHDIQPRNPRLVSPSVISRATELALQTAQHGGTNRYGCGSTENPSKGPRTARVSSCGLDRLS